MPKPKGILHITFVKATNIKTDWISKIIQLGTINPYVICSLNRRPDHPELIEPNDMDSNSLEFMDELIQRTPAASGSNPIWNTKLTFIIHSKADRFYVDIYDKELSKADHLGGTVIELNSTKLGLEGIERNDEWIGDIVVPLDKAGSGDKTGGTIQMLVHYQPM
ncbi:hypothetical protein HDV05_002652, partial [Chytridiales sp. JEL 0842]